MFIVNLTYIKPLSEVEKFLSFHIAYLDKHYATGAFICSGRKEPRVGGIIISSVHHLNEINDIVNEDPFFIEKIADYEIIEFHPSKYTESFKSFID